MKSSGLLSEDSNQKANEALTSAIAHMQTAEYQKTRDLSDVIPTAKHLLPPQPKKDSGDVVYDISSQQNRGEREGGGSDEEDDDDIAAWRAKRAMALKRTVEQAARHGGYEELDEKDFFKTVVRDQGGSDCVVIHFYHPKFTTCAAMDKELSLLCGQMKSVKFVKVNVEKAPFLVDKLSVQVLPQLVFFRDDVMINRMIGFDDCGGESFSGEDLQKQILKKLKLD